MYLVSVIVAIFLGLIPAQIAKSKGKSFGWWWLFGAALFIVALPMALLMDPEPAEIEKQKLRLGLVKCPFCAEYIKTEARVCRFCGNEIPATVAKKIREEEIHAFRPIRTNGHGMVEGGGKKWRLFAAHAALWIFIALVMFPLVMVVGISFRKGNFATGAGEFSLEHWRMVLGLPVEAADGTMQPSASPVLRWFWNSVKVSGVAAFLILALSSTCAYAFARMKFRGREGLMGWLLVLQMFPMVLALIAIYAILEAIGRFVPALGLDSHGGLILALDKSGAALTVTDAERELQRVTFLSDNFVVSLWFDGLDDTAPLVEMDFAFFVARLFQQGLGPVGIIGDALQRVVVYSSKYRVGHDHPHDDHHEHDIHDHLVMDADGWEKKDPFE